MISGTVSYRRAYVNLTLIGSDGHEHEIEAVVDTGFTGMLTLPSAAVAALSLTYLGPQPATLGDGGWVMTTVHELTLLWNEEERQIEVMVLDGDPIIGMTLLEGSELRIRVEDGGSVNIEPLED